MAGYASWSFADIEKFKKELKADPTTSGIDVATPGGILVAADVAFQTSEKVSVGFGGFNNTFGLKVEDNGFTFADQKANLFSFYTNIFYQHIGAQVGVLRFSSTDDTIDPNTGVPDPASNASETDFDFFLAGRSGGEKWSAGAGAGAYYLGGDAKETVLSAYVNGSFKLTKGISIDAGYWYLGETKAGDDSASRLSAGAGFTF